MQTVAKLTEKLLRRRLISPEQSEWCAYLVECKLEQLLCFSVLITFGCLIAPLWKVLLLNWGVVFLRRKANGLHLHTFWAVCFPHCAVNCRTLDVRKSDACGCRAAAYSFIAYASPCCTGQ